MVRTMPYANKFVLNAIVDGHIVPDPKNDGNISLPFGAEYALRFRNRHNRRAVVKVAIDGENVSGGGWVIPASSFIDVERTSDVAKKFKFVSLESEDAADYGKDGPNPGNIKGTVTAQFFLEKEPVAVPYFLYPYGMPASSPYGPTLVPRTVYSTSGTVQQPTASMGYSGAGLGFAHTRNSVCRGLVSSDSTRGTETFSMDFAETEVQDGCTVEGAASDQRFTTAYIDHEAHGTTVQLRMRGFPPEDAEVHAPAPKKVTRVRHDVKPAAPQATTAAPQSSVEAEDLAVKTASLEAENLAMSLKIAKLENLQLRAALAALENKALVDA